MALLQPLAISGLRGGDEAYEGSAYWPVIHHRAMHLICLTISRSATRSAVKLGPAMQKRLTYKRSTNARILRLCESREVLSVHTRRCAAG